MLLLRRTVPSVLRQTTHSYSQPTLTALKASAAAQPCRHHCIYHPNSTKTASGFFTRFTKCTDNSRPRPVRIPFARGRRRLSSSAVQQHGHLDPPKPGEERHVTFIDKEGNEYNFVVADGDNLLDIAQANDLEMEGACGGSCACSTCHVIVRDEAYYDKMAEPDDDENDMLDLAFGLTETSRLGCQIKMSEDLDGLVVKLPSMTRNLQASDFKGKE